jgi:hypothetical protein
MTLKTQSTIDKAICTHSFVKKIVLSKQETEHDFMLEVGACITAWTAKLNELSSKKMKQHRVAVVKLV